jgi:hypothetical protein
MERKKRLELWQIWHVEFQRPRSRRTDDDHRCYQLIARLDRRGKNYWVGVDTTANPPMWASFAVFDDFGREVEPDKAVSRSLSKRCMHKCFFKTRSLEENMAPGTDVKGKSKKVTAKSLAGPVHARAEHHQNANQKSGFPPPRE